ncbi:MOSC domain-containing protein [Nocardioides silvaticus]|nr:MOSC domain-containing protein [Nocardioides silvaticus]
MTPTVVAIHIAKGRRLPMQAKDRVEVEAGKGIVGDRYHGAKHRHVSVQSRESLDQAAEIFGREVLSELTRRNITISHGPVPRDPGALLRIGDVLLEAVRVAAPCKLLDDTIGAGAQEALRRRAGTVFRVLEGGSIAVGDPVLQPDLLPIT